MTDEEVQQLFEDIAESLASIATTLEALVEIIVRAADDGDT